MNLIGQEMTLRLIELHGGTQLFIPKLQRADAGHRLARELSPEAERVLVEAFANSNLKVPLCKAWRAQLYREGGMTIREIARRLGCTERGVARYLAPEPITRQLSFRLTG